MTTTVVDHLFMAIREVRSERNPAGNDELAQICIREHDDEVARNGEGFRLESRGWQWVDKGRMILSSRLREFP